MASALASVSNMLHGVLLNGSPEPKPFPLSVSLPYLWFWTMRLQVFDGMQSKQRGANAGGQHQPVRPPGGVRRARSFFDAYRR
jgi:hypothetical protein